jgi:hypothetical protein
MSSILNQHVLVLNRLWQAVNVCTARRALTLAFSGACTGRPQSYRMDLSRPSALANGMTFPSRNPHPESVRTVSFGFRVPRVIPVDGL